MAGSAEHGEDRQIPARPTMGRVDADTRRRRPHQLTPDEETIEFKPIAIVGMALRLPGGVCSPSDFWSMLMNKEDGRCEVPGSRYNIEGFHHSTEARSIRTRHGYYLKEDPALFDAGFFSITALEAERMDPQQRLLLEVAWECLESSGERDWRGKRIGCYVGVFGGDWLELACKDTEAIDRYRAIGIGDFALSNRISYEFDLRGPSMTIETGCSASLSSLHEACLGLQTGTCTTALVCGTNLIHSPSMTITMTQNGVLSPDGICRTFDASANGYGRGEAINAVYIKPLAAAIRDGNPIRAVIRATGSNFDGRTPNITSPCPDAQEALIRSTYARARIAAIEETALFECHGTATVAGDTVEASVAARVFGGHGVWIGAVKPNVGHSEGASGLTSLIKTVLALENRIIPPNIHFESPNPDIPFEQGKLMVPLEATPWPDGRRQRASVNSFGIGGSNVHVVVDSAAELVPSQRRTVPIDGTGIEEEQPKLLFVSAPGEESLQRRITQVTDYANNKEKHGGTLQDLAYTVALLTQLSHRAYAVVQPSSPIDPSIFRAFRAMRDPHLTFVFTGQGAQWAGMGHGLMSAFPEFHRDILEMDKIIDSIGGPGRPWSLADELSRLDPDSPPAQAELTQPLVTALQIALFNLLAKRFGITPSAVVGHSSGETAAAYAAGAITMRAAILIAYLKGKAVASLEGTGAMAAIALPRSLVTPYLTTTSVVLACENSPKNVTLAGDDAVVSEVMSRIHEDHPEVLCRRLRVSIPYHSPTMKQVGPHFETIIEPHMEYQPGSTMLPMFSSVQPGSIRDPAHLNAHYWRENLESPVLFQGAVHDLLTASGSNKHIFVEIGPHPLLTGPCQQIAKGTGTAKEPPTLVYIPTVRRNEVTTANATNAHTQILEAVATAHCNGVLPTIDLRRATGPGLALTDLPRYPWDHGTRYWLANRMVTDWRMGSAPRHELLGRRVTDSSDAEPLWRNLFFLQEVEWLEEHVLAGQVLFPAAGYIAMAGEAVQQLHPEGQGYSIRKVVFKAALILTEFNQVEMITALKPVRLNDLVTSDWYAFTISAHGGTAWTTHCHGEVRPGFDFPPKARTGNIKRSLRRRVDAARWYQVLRNRGLEYGARFRGLKDVTADPIQRTCIAGVTDTIPTPESGHSLHPVVIDQCLQAMSVAWANGIGRRLVGMGIPLAIEKLYVHAARETMTVDVQVAQAGHNKQLGQATLLSSEGEVLLSMGDAVFFSVDNQLALGATPLIPLASEIRWAPDIDLLPASSLTRMTDMDAKTQKAFHDCILASQLAIWLTEERLRDVSPAAPHMVKWKAWVGEQAARIRRGEAMFVEEMRAFRAKPHEQQEAEVQSMTERYSSDDQWKGCSHTIQAVYDNCVALAKGETTAIDLLLAGNHLKDYYRAVQARFDWTQFLPAIGHGNPRLRVLEIGAGTGSATAAVLESLRTPEGARLYSQYAFTDISPGLITAAREEFQHPGIDFSVLDITKDPEEQGFRPHAYDLVIAGNVLHATPKLGDTLRHVRKLLAPGGWLLLQELTTPGLLMTDYIMGTIAGWWIGEDDDRPDHPYVGPERWDRELRGAGFTGNESIAFDSDESLRSSFTMLTRIAPDPTPVDECVGADVDQSAVSLCSPGSHTSRSRDIALLTNGEPDAWALDLAERLRSGGYLVQFVQWDDTPAKDQCIIALVELDGPFLYELDERRYQTLQDFIVRIDTQQLFWVTRNTLLRQGGAQTCEIDPRYALAFGFAAALRLEMDRRFINIQIDGFHGAAADALLRIVDKVLARDLQRPDLDREYEFAVVQGTVHVSRCHWVPTMDLVPDEERADVVYKLDVQVPGVLDTLQWVQAQEQPVGRDDVEIEMHYIGLNFRDLMVAMGLVGDATEFGLEGTGRVRRVGEHVTNLEPGNEVVVVTGGVMRNRVVVDQKRCGRLDKEHAHLDLEGAATMPTVFATALWVFVHLARLCKGQTVLIHSGCGGVGLASIRVCQQLGAKIFATVGNEEKAQYLVDRMGIPRDCIFNSRDASFLPDIMRQTKNRGVDVVLNSLAGNLLHASWECVAPYGQFFEIGKRDFFTHGSLDMSPFLQNRAFHGVDLEHLADANWQELLREFEKWTREGKIAPLEPRRVFDARDVVEAFRYIQTGTHIGKILLKMPDPAAEWHCKAKHIQVDLQNDAVYLLVGGLGGLGRAIATWMWERGARHFIFLSRSAGDSVENQKFLGELQDLGCTASAVAGDVADMIDVQRALSQCAGRHLAGVLQLSMVLRDKTFRDMLFSDWTAALAPKVQGTWNLHQALQGRDLDFFVLFGSATSVTGNFGQANYAAANSFLDAFAGYRRQQGVPCSVVHLGPVEDIGMVSENPRILQRARELAIRLVDEKEVMDALALAIVQSPVRQSSNSTHQEAYSSIIGLGTSKPTTDPGVVPIWQGDARFGIYYGMETQGLGETKAFIYRDRVKVLMGRIEAEPSLLDEPELGRELTLELGGMMTEYMPSAADMNEEQVANMKIDSLMAIEIRNAIRRCLGVDITMGEINKAGTIRGLAQLAICHLKAKYKGDSKAIAS